MSKIIIDNLAKIHIDRQKMIQSGFSAQKFDDVLRGKSSYKLNEIIAISEKFQLSLDYLIYGKEKSSPSELSEEEQECLDKFNRLTDIDKGKIIERMDVMYSSYTPELKENA